MPSMKQALGFECMQALKGVQTRMQRTVRVLYMIHCTFRDGFQVQFSRHQVCPPRQTIMSSRSNPWNWHSYTYLAMPALPQEQSGLR